MINNFLCVQVIMPIILYQIVFSLSHSHAVSFIYLFIYFIFVSLGKGSHGNK